MKGLLLAVFLMTGCSTAKMFKASDVVVELKKNSTQLDVLSYNVDRDYEDKLAFYKRFSSDPKNKNGFVVEDLTYRMNDLKKRHDSILSKSSKIKAANDGLMEKLEDKKIVRESDPIFKKIDTFGDTTGEEAKILFSEYASYKEASIEFARFALFTGSVYQKSTQISR